jgi:hypothetical protein
MFDESSIALQGNNLTPQSLELMSRPMRKQATLEIERVVANGLAANTREQVRALLTHTALQNVGVLSAMESQMITLAPLGAARYQAIVDSYAMGAAQMIMRW